MRFVLKLFLILIWLIPIYFPWFANGRPAWLFGIAFATDLLSIIIHILGHQWGAARYGLKGGGHYVSFYFNYTKISGFDNSSKEVQKYIISRGLLSSIIFSGIALIILIIFDEHNSKFYFDLLNGSTESKALSSFSLNLVFFYFFYTNLFRFFLNLLPFLRYDAALLFLGNIGYLDNVTSHKELGWFASITGSIILILNAIVLFFVVTNMIELHLIWILWITCLGIVLVLYKHMLFIVISPEDFEDTLF